MKAHQSQAYYDLLERGPFPDRIDPWAEHGRYFQQIHAEMISVLRRNLKIPLREMGYIIGRETSLQIAEGREPDAYIQRTMQGVGRPPAWNYEEIAAELLAEPGVLLENAVDIGALHIRDTTSGRLVTVIELISPGNKTTDTLIYDYQSRRERLIVEHGVHVLEVDATRSVKRLLYDGFVQHFPYHVVVFIAGESPRFMGVTLENPLPRIAIPLHQDAIAAEFGDVYHEAYTIASIAEYMLLEDHYTEQNLPFPSTLTNEQRKEALKSVSDWKHELDQLRAQTQ